MTTEDPASVSKKTSPLRNIIIGCAIAIVLIVITGKVVPPRGNADPYMFSRSFAELSTIEASFKVVVMDTLDIDIQGIANDKYAILLGIFPGHARAGFELQSFTARDVAVSGSRSNRKIEIWLPHANVVSAVTDTPQQWPELERNRPVDSQDIIAMWAEMEDSASAMIIAKADSMNLAGAAESSLVILLKTWGNLAGYSQVIVTFGDN
jgi:hypothetical protein